METGPFIVCTFPLIIIVSPLFLTTIITAIAVTVAFISPLVLLAFLTGLAGLTLLASLTSLTRLTRLACISDLTSLAAVGFTAIFREALFQCMNCALKEFDVDAIHLLVGHLGHIHGNGCMSS
ncbi:hypothetical protein [Phascolarctobacterium faecium]|uniref:hypothetical protein n=1 Tax=Phascolarctobacterium faecium TaxID=33025 RepID=UPI00351FEE11